MSISCDIAAALRFTCMNTRAALSLIALILSLIACGTEESAMSRHQVCERLATATCERLTACEPLVAQTGCEARAMARCCPDGVCPELVIADAERLAACEAAVTTMSCTALTDGDMPESCEHLTDPVPDTKPDAGTPPGDAPEGDEGVLEVNWDIYGGGAAVECARFHGTQTIRILATTPQGDTITRDFSCSPLSALTTLPVGVYSIVAQARAGNGTVVQQTTAKSVGVSPAGSSASFTFTVTTTLGGYCAELATAVCNACAPSEATCKTELVSECCGADGICGRAAIVDPQTWSSCLGAWSSGSYCTATSGPAVCQGAIDVF